MELLVKELKEDIQKLEDKCGNKHNLSDDYLDKLFSVYPFNRFEYVISHLIAENVISLDDYLEIRNAYVRRNKYLYLFEMAPRTFGETWGQQHLNELVPELDIPSKKLDQQYSGQYDFWYDGISIEVKASRVVKRKSGDSLLEKALLSDSSEGFDMNFQQLKPGCADVFIFIAVWKNAIRYWVLSSDDIKTNKYFSKGQHRGNIGEGQLWITDKNINDFDEYEAKPRDLLKAIIDKSK
jgi:hypothetical protein